MKEYQLTYLILKIYAIMIMGLGNVENYKSKITCLFNMVINPQFQTRGFFVATHVKIRQSVRYRKIDNRWRRTIKCVNTRVDVFAVKLDLN